MHFKEDIALKGRLRIFLNDELVVDDENLVVDTGKSWAAKMLGGQGNPITMMKVGNNSAAPDALQYELVGTVLADLPLTNPGGDVYVNTIEFIATAGPGIADGPIQECGLWASGAPEGVTNPPGETMVARKAFAVVNKGPTDVMSFIWTLIVVEEGGHGQSEIYQ